MLNCQVFASEIQTGLPISTVTWVDEDTISSESGKRTETLMEVETTLAPVALVTIGAAYERVKDSIEATWKEDPLMWPSELQYFRHCRNAAFHGNHFLVLPYRGGPTIDPENPPTWRSSKMPDTETMNTKTLIGDWLGLGDVPILLGDIDELLRGFRIRP
jgi:hypothetical protein